MGRKLRPHEVALKSDYVDYAENMAAHAEVATNGVLWNRKGAAKRDAGRITAWELFTGSWSVVGAYASDELIEWFVWNGRMTFTEYRAQVREYNREAYANYLESVAA